MRKLVTPFATTQVLRGLRLALRLVGTVEESGIAYLRVFETAGLKGFGLTEGDKADLYRAIAWLDRAELMRKEDRR